MHSLIYTPICICICICIYIYIYRCVYVYFATTGYLFNTYEIYVSYIFISIYIYFFFSRSLNICMNLHGQANESFHNCMIGTMLSPIS